MGKIKIIQLLLILIILMSINICSTEINSENLLHSLYNYEFDELHMNLSDLFLLHPESIELHYIKTTIYWWYISVDPYNDNFKETFLYESQKTIKLAETEKNKTQNEYLILGGVYCYIGRYYLFRNDWRKAYRNFKKGKKYLEKINIDSPIFYDASFGLGIYNYYAGILPSFIKTFSFLFGLRGDKEKGLNELLIATHSSDLLKVEAKSFLGFIYIYHENKYEKAIDIFNELSTEYPQNVQFKRLLSEAWRKKGEYEQAISICKEILENLNYTFISRNEKAEIFSTIGFLFQQTENHKMALHYYCLSEAENSSINFFILSPWKYYNIAYCYEKENKIENAYIYYKKVQDCEDAFGYHERAKNKIEQLEIK